MASLTTCLKRAGEFLPAEDRAAILSSAQEIRASGAKAAEAGRAAVFERLELVRQELSAAELRLQSAESGKPQAQDASQAPPADPGLQTLEDVANLIRPMVPDLSSRIDALLESGQDAQALREADPQARDRMAAIAAQFPDLQVMVDGMEKPMPMAEFLAAAKAEADDLAADAPLMQVAAECALVNGL